MTDMPCRITDEKFHNEPRDASDTEIKDEQDRKEMEQQAAEESHHNYVVECVRSFANDEFIEVLSDSERVNDKHNGSMAKIRAAFLCHLTDTSETTDPQKVVRYDQLIEGLEQIFKSTIEE